MNLPTSHFDDFEKRLLVLRPAKNPSPEAQVQYRCGYEAGYQQGLLAVESNNATRAKQWPGVMLAATLLIACVGFAAYQLGRTANSTTQPIADASPVFVEERSPTNNEPEDAPEITGDNSLRMEEATPAISIPKSWWFSLAMFGQRDTTSADIMSPLTSGSSIKLRGLGPEEASKFLLAHAYLDAPVRGPAKSLSKGGGMVDSETGSPPYSIRMSGEAWDDLLRSL